jgi:hypothetical protein
LDPQRANAYLLRGLAKIHLDRSDDEIARDFQKCLRLSREVPFLLQLQILEIESRINEARRHKTRRKLFIAKRSSSPIGPCHFKLLRDDECALGDCRSPVTTPRV